MAAREEATSPHGSSAQPFGISAISQHKGCSLLQTVQEGEPITPGGVEVCSSAGPLSAETPLEVGVLTSRIHPFPGGLHSLGRVWSLKRLKEVEEH